MKLRHSAALAAFLSCAALCAAPLVFLSCADEPASQVGREKLFTLSYGRFEDEIDLFQLDSNSTGPDTQIFMRDGMFYISNSGSRKILQLTSFGDLLSVYYNPETNPVPSFAAEGMAGQGTPDALSSGDSLALASESAPSGASPAGGAMPEAKQSPVTTTRKAISYPFNHPVFLTADTLKRLYVVDQIPSERFEYDNEDQVALRDVVLRFNPDGRFVDYIGQEGPGGTPFPPVTGVYNNSRNETIVTAKTQTGFKVYWYDGEGSLLFRIPVSLRNLPSPYEADKVVLASLEKIIPDPDSRRLYLKIDYYAEVIDQDTQANAGISFDRSCVYPLDIASGKYEDRIDLPPYEGVDKDNLGTVAFRKPYELLGITTSGWLFLTTPQDGGYALVCMDSRSRRVHKRVLAVRDDELAYNALSLSADGIISALLATPYDASVVWWRTDSLIGEIRR
jgi:hypothetical protein